jgi:serine/threonine-protein kinase RsbW
MTLETPNCCSIVVKSVPSALTDVCSQILSKLQVNSYRQDDIFAIHLALEEAFLNAIKHGNQMDPNKEVRIDCSIEDDKVEIAMTDQGRGFDPDIVPDPRTGKNLYKPEGRGLFLINSYMDVVKFNERGNCVYMVRYKKRPPIEGTQQ